MNEEVYFPKLTDKIYDDSGGTSISYGVYYQLYESALKTLVRTLDYRRLKNYE